MIKPSDLQHLIPLGQGPGTRVFRAQDPEGRALLLKTFSLADAPNWKAQELFEREGQILQHLNHPHLPQLLAYGIEDGVSYLIYPFIAGESLQHKLANGWRPTQAEALELIRQLLKTLIWLHDRQPPVVHRDVKPSNLILTAENQLYLIDFGSVLQHLKPQGGSTVAGTFGYMAPEQLSGRALPASDLYAVGATLIHLLSGKAPAELPQERLWIKFEDHVQLSAPLRNWLKSLIHPVLEERCQSASEALANLETACLTPTAPALVNASQSQTLASLISRPLPQPNSGQKPIELKQVPQGLSILLPQRPTARNTKPLIIFNISAVTISVGLYIAFFAYDLHFAVAPEMIELTVMLWVLFSYLRYSHHQEINSQQTHLILSEDQLRVNFSYQHKDFADKDKSYSIPLSQILGITQSKKSQRLKLVYRDAKTGKKRKLTLGETLSPDEQSWLQAMLAEKSQQK